MGQQTINAISPNELLGETSRLKNDGFRMVAITCTNKNGIELSYSFDKDYELVTLRLNVTLEDEVNSISNIYPFAFLYENEIKELFGAKIMNISLDFNGNLYKTSEATPFYTEKSSSKENE